MTTPSAAQLAGSDGPHRRPAGRRPAYVRAVLVGLFALLVLGALSSNAVAQTPSPTPPPVPGGIGIGPADPPPPPVLPTPKGGKKGGKKGGGAKGQKAGKHKGKKGGKKGGGTQEAGLKASCGGFGFIQTYTNWGPAIAYAMPVTVSYSASRCSTPDGTSLDLSVDGTAEIHEGTSLDGTLLGLKPFSVRGTWQNPANEVAWPPAWWSCDVSYADYTWEIPGLYTFHVSANAGAWTLDVSSIGVTQSQSVHWTYNGCA